MINHFAATTLEGSMQVIAASETDIPAWLALAREVEDLFGASLSQNDLFLRVLLRNIRLRTAFCVREGDGPPGAALLGGLLFSDRHRPVYTLSWLAVAQRSQHLGVGHALVAHALARVEPPAEVLVTTFVEGTPGGEAARHFYLKEGFTPAEVYTEESAQRALRQRFRKKIDLPGELRIS